MIPMGDGIFIFGGPGSARPGNLPILFEGVTALGMGDFILVKDASETGARPGLP
jgi:hypothetical protein